ncbi:serine/threonine protein kinase [Nonomuraea thailandensis]|uniref:non-specific serine/threonine protein kinase n=1 Tax=Nonomuraea thailandensis TaxID=1188745 RepID=A0A9X2GP84_9ACTN|nr:serine/threonine protein kinase [Nonomuraea thailandensis]MCP2359206.1 serine/threonine protein kinase [Nonomuraea thailandensis]
MPNVEPLREGDPAAVGPYRLVGRLGAGGHGVVYLGQARNGTPVAVKVLREGLAVGERLVKDIAAARNVEPFCLAQVLDASTSGRPYIVSEYVDGPSLQQAGRRGAAELQRLAVATATALDAIHQAGVVHGDLTPANVLLGPDGARVVDFGIAAALSSGMKATSNIVGTPAYMAPEQLAGRPVGAEADVFSWASVLVFAATGVPPFGDDSLPAVINRILREEPVLGELGRPLREVVTACLAKDPAARPSMRDVLLRLTAPSRQTATPYAAPEPSRVPEPPAPSDPRDAWQDTVDHPPVRPPAADPRDALRRRGPTQPPTQPHMHGQVQAPEQAHGPAQHRGPRPEHGRSHADPAVTHEGPGPATSPLQALFDLSSQVEQPPAAPGSHPSPAREPFGGAAASQATAAFAAPGVSDRRGPLGAPVAFDDPPAAQYPPAGGPHGDGPYGDEPHGDGPYGNEPHGNGPYGNEPHGNGTPAPQPKRRRGRRVKKVMIAGVSAVSVCALGAAIVWLTPTTPTPKTKNVAVTSGAPTTSAATPAPRRTRTTRPTPQTDGTPSTVPSDGQAVSGTPTAAADRLRVMYVRPGGTMSGECWAGGEVTLQALVRRTGAPVTFTYTWLIDGATAGRATATIAENGQRYLTAPSTLTSSGGTHTVTLRITAPVTAKRTISVTMCGEEAAY